MARMPKRKATSKISGLVESDDEDMMQMSANTGASSPEEPLNERPAKRARGRPKSTGHTKAEELKKALVKAPISGTGTAKQESLPKKVTGRGHQRTATAEPGPQAQNADEDDQAVQDVPDAENVPPDVSIDELNLSEDATLPKKRGRGRKRSNSSKQVTVDGEFEYTPTVFRQMDTRDAPEEAPKRRGRRRKSDEKAIVVPDSQKLVQEVDESIPVDEELVNPRATSASPLKPRVNGQIILRPGQDTSRKRGSVSFSDSEKTTTDPDLRRKLGDMTNKYESLEKNFRNLREIGIIEANANFEKLKKQCEAATAASTELIASLKKELAAQTALGQQSRTLQKKLKERDTEVTGLQSQVDDLSTQLSAAQTDIKALQTKLAAARNATASAESVGSKGSGSAVKNGANRNLIGSAEGAQMSQLAQLKEDLYSDLTGLIIRDVKKRDSDHLYDCIQTGINGTLHFKLAVSHEGVGKNTTMNYDSAEFQYMPLLDTNRDRDLVDILPEYLTVDITFSRQHASKFYTRVIDTLTKRRIDPGD